MCSGRERGGRSSNARARLPAKMARPGWTLNLIRTRIPAIEASKEIIFVTNPNLPAVTDVIKCKEVIKDMDKKPIGVVMNMVTKKGYELSQKEVEILTELPVIASIPHDVNVHRSLAKRTPLVLHKPRSKASREMTRLAGCLVGVEEEKGIKAALSRLFGLE